jgi:hypothetical protein
MEGVREIWEQSKVDEESEADEENEVVNDEARREVEVN